MAFQSGYEFLIVLLMAVVIFELVARRLHMPPALALIGGGAVLAFTPGLPSIVVQPELILLIFLPPLLLSSAYSTPWRDFIRNSAAIASLAIGAVIFTALSVAIVFHLFFPQLPWASGVALGAIVSPPDAVAAKSALENIKLPPRVRAILNGESLVNDATGLVLFHFAVAWWITGTVDTSEAVLGFFIVALGGIGIGAAIAWAGLHVLRMLATSELVITVTLLLAATSYIAADRLELSGVLSTVTTGLMLGWRQHEIFPAVTRIRAQGFWKVLVFLLQSSLFILIGLSLRDTLTHIETKGAMLDVFIPVGAIVITAMLARFVWLLGCDAFWSALTVVGVTPKNKPSLPVTIIVGWAGIRGAVTLAAALALPENFPGRDVIMTSAFAVIIFTIVAQATTLPMLVRRLPSLAALCADSESTDLNAALMRVSAAQRQVLKAELDHLDAMHISALLDRHRSPLYPPLSSEGGHDPPLFGPEYSTALLKALKVGRAEVLRMYRAGEIADSTLGDLERDLDIQEYALLDAR